MQGIISSKRIDIHINILILQTIAVAIVLISAVIIRMFGGNIYRKLSVLYHEKFDDITLIDEVMSPNDQNATDNTSSEDNSTASSNLNFEYELYDVEVDSSLNDTALKIDDADYDSLKVSCSSQSFLFPAEGTVVSAYGMRTNPVTGIYTLHGGIDIAAESGSSIYSAYDGVVTSAGYSSSYGNYVIITHNENIKTLYAHCSKLLVDEGINVLKGQRIALVGSTGRSTGPHLHFEVRIGDNRVDPTWILGGLSNV